jgi:rhodanese-related sulfurtransferase
MGLKQLGQDSVYYSEPAYEPIVACCEHGNEHSGPIKYRTFLEYTGDYSLLKGTLTWN